MTQQEKNTRLIQIAAELLGHKANWKLSDFKDDYSFKIPNHMIYKIEKCNERLRQIAVELSDIARQS